MKHLSDEQWAREVFAPLRAAAEREVPPSECPPPPRIWRVASDLAAWTDDERQHLATCPRCRNRFQEFREAIASKPAAAPAADAEAQLSIGHIAVVLETFRRENARLVTSEEEIRPVAAPALRALDDVRYARWRWAATEDLAAHTADEGPQPAGELQGIEIQDDDLVVRARAELVPYGVVRIFAKADDLLVGTCLLPLFRCETVCSNLCAAALVVGERDPHTVNWYAQPATTETLAWFPAAELESLLDRPEVQDHDELSAKVGQLLELAREREAAL